MNKDISILLPAKGICQYIFQTLKSIEKSTLKPYEVIIVDDGLYESTKRDIKKTFKSLPIRIIENDGEGLISALNTGLNNCTGKYVARIDADDLMHSSRLEIQKKILDNNANVVAIGSNITFINSTSEITGHSNYPTGILNAYSGFTDKCLLAHPSVMFRRAVVLEIGGYRSLFYWNLKPVAEDFDLWLRLSKHGLIQNTKEELIQYRQHNEQISSKNISAQIIGAIYTSAIYQSESEKIKVYFFPSKKLKNYFRIIYFIVKTKGFKVGLYVFMKFIQTKFENGNSNYSKFLLTLNKISSRLRLD